MPLDSIPGLGLVVQEAEYLPRKARQSGGFYWDDAAQRIIRRELGQFLPPVDWNRGHSARFYLGEGEDEKLCRSRPLGRRGLPAGQLAQLRQALDQLKARAGQPGVEADNAQLVEGFRLPDVEHDPELYRLVGAWWSPRLQVLWGCEKRADSSLPAPVALGKLPVDRWHGLRRVLAGLALPLLALLLGLGLWASLPHIRNQVARWLNKPPVAAMTAEVDDPTNRVAAASDAGSRDPDPSGTIRAWIIDWGDAQTTNYARSPRREKHTYAQDGQYQVRMICVDDLGATSKEPATASVSFNYQDQLQQALTKTKQRDEELERERLAQENRTKQSQQAADEARRKADDAEKERLAQQNRTKQSQQAADEARRKADDAEKERLREKERVKPPPVPVTPAPDQPKGDDTSRPAVPVTQPTPPVTPERSGRSGFYEPGKVPVKPRGSFPAPPFVPNIMKSGQSATAEVRIDVADDGKINDVRIEKESGVPEFDRHVVQHIRKRFRFLPPGTAKTYIYECEQRVN
jgi:TonB family protein